MMNRLLVTILMVSAFACSQTAQQEEKEVETIDDEVLGNYGADLPDGDIVDLMTVQSTLDTDSVFYGKIRVEIEDVCQMKGCWMTAKLPDGRSMRITFKDYGFFVPKNSTGYTAVLDGKAIKRMTDEETLKHYAEESGKSKDEVAEITGPSEELSFIASGVVIESL